MDANVGVIVTNNANSDAHVIIVSQPESRQQQCTQHVTPSPRVAWRTAQSRYLQSKPNHKWLPDL